MHVHSYVQQGVTATTRRATSADLQGFYRAVWGHGFDLSRDMRIGLVSTKDPSVGMIGLWDPKHHFEAAVFEHTHGAWHYKGLANGSGAGLVSAAKGAAYRNLLNVTRHNTYPRHF